MSIYDDFNNGLLYFEESVIRVIIDKDEILWFNLSDTTRALNLKGFEKRGMNKNVRKYIRIQKDIESDMVKGQPSTMYIGEPGLYRMFGSSTKPLAVRFTNWLYEEVAPSLRKYGKYKMKIETEKELDFMMKKINNLEQQLQIALNDLKCEKYPNGGIFYVIKYGSSDNPVYRIGITMKMTRRKSTYDTHSLNRKQVVFYTKSSCPIQLELCVRAMLYNKRYQNKRDFYKCDLDTIIDTVNKCKGSIETSNLQKGGSVGTKDQLENFIIVIKKSKAKTKYLQKRIETLEIIINEL